MTDYKRMVSYMYQYENGLKRRNVGFAKVEAKGGQCKFTLHMQLLGQLDSIFPTYLIQRGKAGMELIYLGDTFLKNQVMDSRLSADENNIMGTGYKLTDMSGLLLFFNDKIFYATVWDDSPLVKDEILEALRPKKDRQGVKSETAPSKNSEPNIRKEQEIKQSAEGFGQTREIEEQTVTELKIPNYMLPGGYKMVERLRGPAKPPISEEETHAQPDPEQSRDVRHNPESIDTTSPVYPELISNETEAIEDTEEAGDMETTEDTEAASEPEESQASGIANNTEFANTGNFTEKLDQDMEERLYKIIEELNASGIPQAAQVNTNQVGNTFQADPPVAKHFFDHYPRIYPFEDNEVIHCVKIEPKDIGLLPQEIWPYGNNSFLMHGYYCYHHLIFAKLKSDSGFIYILGIPGIYHGREQFMARMFGFENFKSIKKHELKQGDFGYWYLPVAL